MEGHADGQRHSGSPAHPDAILGRFLYAESFGDVHAKRMLRSPTERSGSSDISRKSATTTSSCRPNGTSETRSGGSTTSSPERTGGRAVYPADQMQRPTGHAVRRLPLGELQHQNEDVTEWNVGCEKCHGAGGAHVRRPDSGHHHQSRRSSTTFGPMTYASSVTRKGSRARIPSRVATTIGRSATSPGDRLSDFWKLEEHQFGKETFTHWPDGRRTRTECRATTTCRARCT